jgi:hypothetical protein
MQTIFLFNTNKESVISDSKQVLQIEKVIGNKQQLAWNGHEQALSIIGENKHCSQIVCEYVVWLWQC